MSKDVKVGRLWDVSSGLPQNASPWIDQIGCLGNVLGTLERASKGCHGDQYLPAG